MSDVFGTALWRWHGGRRDIELSILRDDGHVDRHSPDLYFKSEPLGHEADLLAGAEGPLLDIGCGAGRTVLWAERQGLDAKGIDVSPRAVETCRARGCTDVRLHDILDGLPEPAIFRTITVFGNNLGIGGTRQGVLGLLEILGASLAPGGRLLVTGLDVARTDRAEHLDYHARNRAVGRPIGQIEMQFHCDGEISPWIPWIHPEPDELCAWAEETGWSVAELRRDRAPFFAATLVRSGHLAKSVPSF